MLSSQISKLPKILDFLYFLLFICICLIIGFDRQMAFLFNFFSGSENRWTCLSKRLINFSHFGNTSEMLFTKFNSILRNDWTCLCKKLISMIRAL